MGVKFTGTEGDDLQTGVENQRNSMAGFGGNDVLVGGDLDDVISGDAGDDLLYGGSGFDIFYGGDGDDGVYGGDGSDFLYSGIGDDYLDGGTGDDQIRSDDGIVGDNKTLSGGAGDDWFVLGNGADAINGGSGEDLVDYRQLSLSGISVNLQTGTGSGGLAEGDTYKSIEDVLGTQFSDILIGNGKYNLLYGNAGDDTIRGGAGGDELDGGSGQDTLDYSTSDLGVRINLATNSASGGDAQGDEISDFEKVRGSDEGDILTGTNATNLLNGADGNDVIQGGAGSDLLIGGEGDDVLSYSASSSGVIVDLTSGFGKGGDAEGDLFSGFENITGSGFIDLLMGDAGDNILSGGAGDDILTGGAGADLLIGGADFDTASYATASGGVLANLSDGTQNTGDAKGDTYGGIESLAGSSFSDTLIGESMANSLIGGGGNDTLIGGAGADNLYGGNNVDTASYASATSAVAASLANDGTGVGDAQGDYFTFIENLVGSKFNDVLTGDAKNNVLTGGSGADALNGGGGVDKASYAGSTSGVVANLSNVSLNTGEAKGDTYASIENLEGSGFGDVLTGTTSGNSISAGAGNDILVGGAGADQLNGGTGADTFLFKAIGDTTFAPSGQDTVMDFSHGQGDKVDLSGIDANAAVAGNQAFVFKGADAFSGGKAELHFEIKGLETILYGDLNGDKIADFAINFHGAIAFEATDFLL